MYRSAVLLMLHVTHSLAIRRTRTAHDAAVIYVPKRDERSMKSEAHAPALMGVTKPISMRIQIAWIERFGYDFRLTLNRMPTSFLTVYKRCICARAAACA